jgi:hypothetical protein
MIPSVFYVKKKISFGALTVQSQIGMGVSKFLCRVLYAGTLFLALGCSKDSDDPADPDNFYSGAITNASSADLLGYWAIFEAEYEGARVPIPINFTNCGRDFFVYREGGVYQEYLYRDSSCETNISQLAWELDKGVITLSTLSGSTDDLVIIKLTGTELYFKTRFDVDDDGKLDVVVLIAKRFTPNEVDFYTRSFQQDGAAAENDLIGFTWQAYDGFNTFQKYEVYRSSDSNCSKLNAELLATFTDVNETTFTDLTPPANSAICYFLKIYTDKGLLGESFPYYINTSTIGIDPVNLDQPTVAGNTISLSWAASEAPYFSHYEILVANHVPGTGYGYQDISVAIINDRDTTTWTDEDPPYLENPYYYIRAYNIFGNYTDFSTEVNVYQQAIFKRPEILPLQQIVSYAVDRMEPVVYFFGQESGDGYTPYRIFRINYDTHETEAVTLTDPQAYTAIPIKVMVSSYGKEVVILQGSELYFYDAATLQFKYALDPDGVASMKDFNYDDTRNLWVVSDENNIYTLQRGNGFMTLIDSAPHFTAYQSGIGYEFIILKNGQYLLGHPDETTSFVFDLDVNGNFTGSQSVNIQFRSIFDNERLLYNSAADLLLDTQQQEVFSSTTFQNVGSFLKPNVPSGISVDGTTILGTDNEYSWPIENDSPHKKEAVLFNPNTNVLTNIETIGYPHILFENFRGEVIGISSGFKKEDLYQNINNTSDFFMEKVQVP